MITRCESVSDQGLRCGLDSGHRGEHNALAVVCRTDADDASPKATARKLTRGLDYAPVYAKAIELALVETRAAAQREFLARLETYYNKLAVIKRATDELTKALDSWRPTP